MGDGPKPPERDLGEVACGPSIGLPPAEEERFDMLVVRGGAPDDETDEKLAGLKSGDMGGDMGGESGVGAVRVWRASAHESASESSMHAISSMRCETHAFHKCFGE